MMNPDVHWSVWLLAGMAAGLIPIFGENRLLGLLQVAVVIASPILIFMKAGTAYLPFVLFYGGLMLVSSFLFKRKTAQEDRKRKDSLEAKKKRWG
jgi:hypothetical protein